MEYFIVGFVCAFIGYMLAVMMNSASTYSRDGEDK